MPLRLRRDRHCPFPLRLPALEPPPPPRTQDAPLRPCPGGMADQCFFRGAGGCFAGHPWPVTRHFHKTHAPQSLSPPPPPQLLLSPLVSLTPCPPPPPSPLSFAEPMAPAWSTPAWSTPAWSTPAWSTSVGFPCFICNRSPLSRGKLVHSPTRVLLRWNRPPDICADSRPSQCTSRAEGPSSRPL